MQAIFATRRDAVRSEEWQKVKVKNNQTVVFWFVKWLIICKTVSGLIGFYYESRTILNLISCHCFCNV